jgi:hypothetical protein
MKERPNTWSTSSNQNDEKRAVEISYRKVNRGDWYAVDLDKARWVHMVHWPSNVTFLMTWTRPEEVAFLEFLKFKAGVDTHLGFQ